MRQTLLIALISILPMTLFSQRQPSKEEIYKYSLEWEKKHIEKALSRNDFSILNFRFRKKVVDFRDSLIKSGVDTIGIYSTDFVGGITYDKCDCGIIPWTAIVNWKMNGKLFYRKFKECCSFKQKGINYSVILGYYYNCSNELKNEYIVDAITGVETDTNGKITSLKFIKDVHATQFTIYCKVGKDTLMKWFDSYQLDAKEGMFQKENLDTRQFSWMKLIENQNTELEKDKNP